MMLSFGTQGQRAAFAWPPTSKSNVKSPSKIVAKSVLPKTHSMPPEKTEVFKSLETWATQNVLPMIKPVEKSWQPHDLLPDSSSEDEFIDKVKALRDRTKGLPDDYLVVLVGSMITEEALPSYQTWLNKHDGIGDETGVCNTPWAIWTRSWTAEENRHGDLLKTYLYLSGRVDMHVIEKTIQYLIAAGMVIKYLIAAGMNLGSENNPYMGFVYTSFQERATFEAHGKLARLAKENGDLVLAHICGTIAADEKRHEKAYNRIVEKLLEVDPSETMVAIANMMHRKITMPAHLMYDGSDPHLFKHFSAVAQRTGIYTSGDYVDILEFLIGKWKLEKLQNLTSEGKRAQEFVCGLASKIKRLQERANERVQNIDLKFSWIFDKNVCL